MHLDPWYPTQQEDLLLFTSPHGETCMTRTEYKLTDLSVKDEETGDWVLDMGDQDDIDIPMDAGEPLIGVEATLSEVRTEIESGTLGLIDYNGQEATINVSGLQRGLYYELAVTFENEDGKKWTRTLVIHCVS